jgi:hypothetical protein
MDDRPKVGSIGSLYWVLGYWHAAEGKNVNPFKPEMTSYNWWQQGHDAYSPNKALRDFESK